MPLNRKLHHAVETHTDMGRARLSWLQCSAFPEHCTDVTEFTTDPPCCCKKCEDGFVPECTPDANGELDPSCNEEGGAGCGCKCVSKSERLALDMAPNFCWFVCTKLGSCWSSRFHAGLCAAWSRRTLLVLLGELAFLLLVTAAYPLVPCCCCCCCRDVQL